MKKLTLCILVLVLAPMIDGCSGGGSTASPPSGTAPPPAPVSSIATPSTISVVTAQ